MAKYYLINEDVGNAILEYLAQRPYREVYKIMEIMQTLREVPEHKVNLLADHIHNGDAKSAPPDDNPEVA
jgi:hypothetical protein